MSGRGEGERAELGRRGVMVDEKGARDSERRGTQKSGMEGGLRTEPKTTTGGSGITTREGERRNELPPHSTTTATGTAVKTPGQKQYVHCVRVCAVTVVMSRMSISSYR